MVFRLRGALIGRQTERPTGRGGDEAAGGGWIDLAARLARVALGSPRVRANVDLLLRHIDPEAAPRLARALVWTDPAVVLGVVSALPRATNAGIGLVHELLGMVAEQPRTLVGEFGAALWDELAFEKLGEVLALALALARGESSGRSDQPDQMSTAESTGRGFWAGVQDGLARHGLTPMGLVSRGVGQQVSRAAERLERYLAEHPDEAAAAAELVQQLRSATDNNPNLKMILFRDGPENDV